MRGWPFDLLIEARLVGYSSVPRAAKAFAELIALTAPRVDQAGKFITALRRQTIRFMLNNHLAFMRSLRFSLFFVALVLIAGRGRGADTTLKISSPGTSVTLSAADFAQLPHSELSLPEQGDEQERHFTGVPVRELLNRVGAPAGEKMRGSGMMSGVIVRCKDNYSVLFALAEFDPNFSARTILLADKEDGEMLPPSAAPYRLVTPGDKRGARSCKQVVSIEVVSLAKP